MLFEVAILEKPRKKEEDDGSLARLVVGPRAVVANDPQGAAVAVALDAGELEGVDRTRLEILVRPFAV